jgi:hypothetical protein
MAELAIDPATRACDPEFIEDAMAALADEVLAALAAVSN